MALPQTPTTTGQPVPKFQGKLARKMVLALLTFSIIPLILMGVAGYQRSRMLMREQVAAQIQTLVDANAAQINLLISAKQVRLDRIVRRPAMTEYLSTGLLMSPDDPLKNQLHDQILQEYREVNLQDNIPFFNQLLVIKLDGTIQFASEESWEGLSIQDSPYFETLLAETQNALSVYGFSPLYTNQFIILNSQPFYDAYGWFLGVVVGISEGRNVQPYLERISTINPNAFSYFVTQEGTFVGIDPYTNELTLFTPSEEQSAFADTIISVGSAETGAIKPPEFTDARDHEVLGQGYWLESFHTGLVVELPLSVVYSQLFNLAPFTISLLAVALVAMTAVIWLGTTSMVKPLLGLADTTRRFAEGEWEARSTIKSNDELGLLADSFNHMAEDLSSLYQTLEHQVEERTRQVRTAAEVAQSITAAFSIDELLNNTVDLIVERFGFYHAGVFLIDDTGKQAVLRAVKSPAAETLLGRAHRLAVGSPSIIGWVTANKQPRLASDVEEDPFHLKNELLPETRAEVGIPIMISGEVLGVLDVQSVDVDAFDPETVVTLQTLANQIATAIQNVRLIETAQLNLQELANIYRTSYQITQAQTEEEVFQAAKNILQKTSYSSILLSSDNGNFRLVAATNPTSKETTEILPEFLEISPAELAPRIEPGIQIVEYGMTSTLPAQLEILFRQMDCQSAALIPVTRDGKLKTLLMIGAKEETMKPFTAQPFSNIAEMVTASLERIRAVYSTEYRLQEVEAITATSQAIASASDLPDLYSILHEHIRKNIGDINFLITLYDKSTDSIHIPYAYEEDQIITIDSFPLGEGLTSILIRTKQPLMIVEDTERRAQSLGAKVVGKPARSWLGAPLIVAGEATGAIIIQDLEREYAFDDEDLRYITTLSSQVAGAIHNVRLLQETRQIALQLQTAAEIARDITGALELNELLYKAVTLIRERFNFYHAAVFLIDPVSEYAVVREATGEAGMQMKRAGHKLGVGSKSIVGYVAGSGEPLIVNDTSRDAMYYQNPLLPETRAEASIPLKVGTRILGVLDVQSTNAYSFSEENIRVLRILSDQLAVAVINTEFFAETQEHLSQQRLLHFVTTAAASSSSLEDGLSSAVQGLQVTLGGDRIAILLADDEKKTLKVEASVGYSEDIAHLEVPIGNGITGWAAAHMQPLRVNDVTKDARYLKVSGDVRSELAIPLVYRKELLGVLNVESDEPNAYNENDEEMLSTLAGSLAAVIANARLVEQVRKQVDRERTLYEMTSKIRRSTDIQTILSTTASELSKAIGARRARIEIGPQKPTKDFEENTKRGIE